MIRESLLEDISRINYLGNKFINNFSNTYNLINYLNDDKYLILVYLVDNEINAFLILLKNIDCYELEMIVVNDVYRQKGIASNLLDYVFNNYLKTDDVIILEVAVNNIPALNLYQKYNFSIINTRKKYYHGIDAYVMKKVI